MRRTTVSLPDEVAEALEREARRRRVPMSAIVRDALSDLLGFGDEDRRRPLPFAGVGASGQGSTARDMEDLLAAEWTARAGGR